MKIAFVEPKMSGTHLYSGLRLPRLGAALLGTILRDEGHHVTVHNEEISALDLGELLSADLVAISATTSLVTRGYGIAGLARERGIPVVIGGSHATFMAEEALEFCDYVLCGEADRTVVAFVEALEGKRELSSVPGLRYRGDGGEILGSPPSRDHVCADLDDLPAPDLSLIHGWRADEEVAPVSTSRGCPFGCRFCTVTKMFGHRVRKRSPELVVEDLVRIPAKRIFFCDDNFTADRSHAKEIMWRMLRAGVPKKWMAQVRVDAARDTELLELMQHARCKRVFVGFESVNSATLESLDKRQSLEEIGRAAESFHRHGLKIHGLFVIGDDQDRVDDLRRIVSFARESALESIQVMILTPYPGTPYLERFRSEGRLLTDDWRYFSALHPVFSPAGMTVAELQMETIAATKEFYSPWRSLRRLFDGRPVVDPWLEVYGRRLCGEWERAGRDYLRTIADAGGRHCGDPARHVAHAVEDLRARASES